MGSSHEARCAETTYGESLLLQHRALMDLVGQLEEQLQLLQANEPKWSRPEEISLPLEHLIRALEAHFKAERASLERDFRDEPQLHRQLLALDEEHPLLLAGFMRARSTALDGVDRQRLTIELRTALDRFREHEAQEDVLFASQ